MVKEGKILLRYEYHHALIRRRIVRVHVINPESHRIRQLGPLRLGPLHSSHSYHHTKVMLGDLPMDVLIRKNHFVKKDQRVWPHGVFELLKRQLAFVVWKIVEYSTRMIELGACDRLAILAIGSRIRGNLAYL